MRNSASDAEGSGSPDIGEPPRLIVTTKRAHLVRVFMLLLVILLPVLFVTQGKRERVKLDALAANGRQAEGVVVQKSSQRSKRTLRYEFWVDGRRFGGEGRVNSSEYDARPMGSGVAVTYLPG